MITVKNVTKTFGSFTALKNVSATIADGGIYGMVGENGAGKSTFLRLLAGVYRPTSGEISFDGAPVYENPAVKQKIVFLGDTLYFLPQATMKKMADFYKAVYPTFSAKRFSKLADTFSLDVKANINTFSKGMKRQAAAVLALAAMPQVLLLDETFDGLDPAARGTLKQVLYDDVLSRGTTFLLTSHSLRELDDTCDRLALLHKGGLILESDIQDLKTSRFKVQVAYADTFDRSRFDGLDLLNYEQSGSVASFLVRGDKDETIAKLRAFSPVLLDLLPLSLEEVFLYEMDALGLSPDGKEKGV